MYIYNSLWDAMIENRPYFPFGRVALTKTLLLQIKVMVLQRGFLH